jgi:hypothetical protein
MRIALALLVVVLAVAAGFGGWIVRDQRAETLLCNDTRPAKFDWSRPQGSDATIDPKIPLTMRCETKP